MEYANLTKQQKHTKLKLQRQKTAWTLFFAVCSLLICNCDLFTKPKDPDFLKKIDLEIAWANAKKLTVIFYAPEGWINSGTPSLSRTAIQRNVLDIRKGFEFSLECEPSSAFGFEQWLAFETEFFETMTVADWEKSAAEMEAHCQIAAEKVKLVKSNVSEANKKGTFIINTETPLTIVPWCSARPRIILSSPPLINTGGLFSLGQTITLYFSEPGLAYENGVLADFFDEGLIQISGQSIPAQGSDAINYYPDLSGHFNAPAYDDILRTISIRPVDLPIEELSIILTVGPDIIGKNGDTMSAPVNISWRTSTDTVMNRYTAENVWAVHDPDTAASEADFFYARAISSSANNYRDARLRKNSSGDYEITLYFSISATNEEEMGAPTHCKVQEFRAFNLMGNNATQERLETTYELTPITAPGSDAAANIYRDRNSNVRAYKITHTIGQDEGKDIDNGIWLLVLVPYRNEASSGIIGLDTWENAYAEERYATVAINRNVPARNPQVTLRGAQASGTGVYNYGASNPLMGFDLNFNNAEDNWHNTGITWEQASDGRPWTIDSFNQITWQWRIADDDYSPGLWLSTVTDRSISGINLKDAIGSSQSIRKIQVRYRTTLGQENEEWLNTGAELFYLESDYGDVSGWSAVYDPDDNTIAVSWTNPAEDDFDHIEVWYRVNGMSEITPAAFISGSTGYTPKGTGFTISSVPRLVTTGVREGTPVSNIYSYEIFTRTHSAVDSREPLSFKIWNFGTPGVTGSGMSVNQSNTAEVNDHDTLANAIADTAKTNIVLSGDIELSDWTPPLTAFARNFFGNGHTLTIDRFSGSAANRGLFGTASNAVIRDLVVVYNSASPMSGVSSETNIGGIAGRATGSTAILNCIVRGANDASVLGVTATAATRLGGIAGYLDDTAYIQNSLAALNVTLTTSRFLSVGGAVGESISSGTLTDIEASAVVVMNKINDGFNNGCGGIAGSLANTSLTRCVFSGKINIPDSFQPLSYSYIGGLVGAYQTRGTADLCEVSGDIIVRSKGSGYVFLGGVAGIIEGQSNDNRVEIKNTVYTNGEISFDISGTPGFTRIGGFVGCLLHYGVVENCHSRAKSVTCQITDTGTRAILIGGFAGQIQQANISDCSSSSPVIVPATHRSTGGVLAGGFSGYLGSSSGTASSLERCYATGSVTVHSRNGVATAAEGTRVGGLVGVSIIINGNETNTIKQCYATGDVTVVNYADTDADALGYSAGGLVGLAHGTDIIESYATGTVNAGKGSGTTPVIAGGLVGFLGWSANSGVSDSGAWSDAQMSSITDSYALGNVTADNSTSAAAPLYAGGLVGYMQINASKAVSNSFARGSVIAQNNGNAAVRAGGLVGFINTGIISNNAALGASVTAKGANATRVAARIYANPATDIGTANYARQSMRVETSSSYSDILPPAMVFESIPPVMTGLLFLQGDVSNAAVGGMFVSDSGGSGLTAASLTNAAMSASGNGSGGSWNGSSITGIDLSSLTATSNSRNFDITLADNAGNSAVYRVSISPNRANPTLLSHFTVSAPTLQGTPTSVQQSAASPHGQAVADSVFYSQSVWTGTGQLNFGSAWNFGGVVGRGYPRLGWE